jgi:hypothetical protein
MDINEAVQEILTLQNQANENIEHLVSKLSYLQQKDHLLEQKIKLSTLSEDLQKAEAEHTIQELNQCIDLFKTLVEVLEKLKQAQIPDSLQQILDACQYQAKGIEELNYQFKIQQQKQERNEAILLTVLEELRALNKLVIDKK